MTRWLKIVVYCAAVVLVVLFSLALKGIISTSLAASSFTFVALVVSLASLGYQIWRTGLVQAADLLMRFEQNFFGLDKRRQRSLASKNNLVDPDDFTEMEDLLDFFETIAMLTRKEALNLEMVWHTFDYWIERYYEIAKPYIEARQGTAPGVWEDLGWLVPKLARLHTKKSGAVGHRLTLSADERLRFLTEEAAEAT